jgi:hypothetical protein
VYWPCTQIPYWPPCCRFATPLQFAQNTPLETPVTVCSLTSGLFA